MGMKSFFAAMLLSTTVLAQTPTTFVPATPTTPSPIRSRDINTAFSNKCDVNADNCIVSVINNNKVTLSDKLRQRIDLVPDFCQMTALANVTTSTACMQNAVTAICSSRPAVLNLPAAYIYVRDLTIPCAVQIHGQGTGKYTDGTVLDYTGATAFGLRWQPPGFPALRADQFLFGPGIDGVSFFTSDNANTAVVFEGFNHGYMTNVAFTGNALNGLLLHGGYKFDINSITGNYLANRGGGLAGDTIKIVGDMSGLTRAGGPCNTGPGDCSTRVDIVSINNWDTLGTNTGNGIHIQGTVNTTTGSNASAENKAGGLKVDCPTGFPDVTYCPQFIWFARMHFEGAVGNSIDLSDFTDFQCDQCFARGNGSGTNHALYAYMQNYTQQGGGGGGVRWRGGWMSNTGASCAYITVSDTLIADANILDCNLANIGAAGTEYISGESHKERDNRFNYVYGINGPLMAGTYIHTQSGYSSPTRVTIYGNDYKGTSSSVVDTAGATGADATIIRDIRGP